MPHDYGDDGVCKDCGYMKNGGKWEWKSDGAQHWLEYTDENGETQKTPKESHELIIQQTTAQGQLDKLVCACGHEIPGVAVHAVNFPDESFRNFIADEKDADKDNFITSAELETITEIKCIDKGIQSLQGIEYFTALKSLKCDQNDLSASGLDVSALGNLELLHVQSCKLSELDLTRNTHLKDLGCNDNKLTELDLSNCPGMLYLWARYNKLTKLDLTGLTQLIDVAVDNNDLTELDVSSMASLKQLGFASNHLTSMNLGAANPATNTFWSDGNSYKITVDTSRKFKLSTLPGNFIAANADNWNGGTVEDGVLTVDGTDPTATVTYDYDCGHNRTVKFTLNVTVHDHTYSSWQYDSTGHWRYCTAANCPNADERLNDGYHRYDSEEDAICNTCGYDRTQPTPEPEPAADSFQPGRDIGGALATAIVAGTAAWGSYEVATRLILHSLLPKGAKVPTARIQLATLLWETAGKPEPAAPPAFADVADPDEAKAAQWCVEQGLLAEKSAGVFDPYAWVTKYKTIKVWNSAKEQGVL